MASVNKVILIGNLGADPELRYTPSGSAVADLGLAVNRKYKAQDGTLKDEVCYVNLTAWGRTAENAAEYLSKGRPVFVEGRLKFDQWESKEGEKRSKLSVVIERLQFLGSRGPAPSQASAPATEGKEPSPGEGSELGPPDEDIPF